MNIPQLDARAYTLGGLGLLLVALVLESQGWILPGLSSKFQLALGSFIAGAGVTKDGVR
jgi:hypothetical protein